MAGQPQSSAVACHWTEFLVEGRQMKDIPKGMSTGYSGIRSRTSFHTPQIAMTTRYKGTIRAACRTNLGANRKPRTAKSQKPPRNRLPFISV